jgi:hypothetical protein
VEELQELLRRWYMACSNGNRDHTWWVEGLTSQDPYEIAQGVFRLSTLLAPQYNKGHMRVTHGPNGQRGTVILPAFRFNFKTTYVDGNPLCVAEHLVIAAYGGVTVTHGWTPPLMEAPWTDQKGPMTARNN